MKQDAESGRSPDPGDASQWWEPGKLTLGVVLSHSLSKKLLEFAGSFSKMTREWHLAGVAVPKGPEGDGQPSPRFPSIRSGEAREETEVHHGTRTSATAHVCVIQIHPHAIG